MALNIDWSPTNRSTNMMARLLGQRGLSKQAHEQSLFREEARQTGIRETDVLRLQNSLREIQQRHLNELDLSDDIVFHKAKVRELMRNNQDPTSHLNEIERISNEMADALMQQFVTPGSPMTQEQARNMSRTLSQENLMKWTQSASGIFEQERKIKEIEEPKMAISKRQLEEVGIPGVKLREEELTEKITARKQEKLGVGNEKIEADLKKVFTKMDALEKMRRKDTVLMPPDEQRLESLSRHARNLQEELGGDEHNKYVEFAKKLREAEVAIEELDTNDTLRSHIESTGLRVPLLKAYLPRPEKFPLAVSHRAGELPSLAVSHTVGGEAPIEPQEAAGVAGELTAEESINVLAGMILEKAKAKGAAMTMEEARAAARRLIGIR